MGEAGPDDPASLIVSFDYEYGVVVRLVSGSDGDDAEREVALERKPGGHT
jgi:hypothetical protein